MLTKKKRMLDPVIEHLERAYDCNSRVIQKWVEEFTDDYSNKCIARATLRRETSAIVTKFVKERVTPDRKERFRLELQDRVGYLGYIVENVMTSADDSYCLRVRYSWRHMLYPELYQ